MDLPTLNIDDRTFEEAVILAPEVYSALAILGGQYNGNIYRYLARAGGAKRSLATTFFQYKAYEKAGIRPGDFGKALKKIATGIHDSMPVSRSKILADFDDFSTRFNLLRTRSR